MSQCDLIAAVLADGMPHTVAEIHERCGYSRLNSRVAELRSRRGLSIECRHLPDAGRGSDAYEYQLVTLKEPSVVVGRAVGAVLCEPVTDGSLSGGGMDGLPPGLSNGDDTAAAAAQLTVFDAIGVAA